MVASKLRKDTLRWYNEARGHETADHFSGYLFQESFETIPDVSDSCLCNYPVTRAQGHLLWCIALHDVTLQLLPVGVRSIPLLSLFEDCSSSYCAGVIVTVTHCHAEENVEALLGLG
jgi:hypothetical protein